MKNLVFISLVFVCLIGFGQKSPYSPINGSQKVIIENNSSIKGDSFIYDEWNAGMLVLNDSVFSKQDFLKYDAFKNKVCIKNMKNPNVIIEIDDNSLTGFSIIERKRNLKHDFVKLQKKNFRSDEGEGFYEIVFNLQNTNYFVKKNVVVLYDPNRSKGSQTINNLPLEYRDKSEYFIKNDEGLYVLVRLNKKAIRAVLNKHTKLVDTYIKENRIKFKKESDIIKLVNYYYSL